jgi:hypothetical protein
MGLKVGPEGLPWPEGNPDGLRAAADRASAMAQALAGQATGYSTVVGPLAWTGTARQSFGVATDTQSRAVARAAHAFTAAAGALRSLAGIVEDAQQEVLAAARKLHAAREAEKTAVDLATTARTQADEAHRAAAASPLPTGPEALQAASAEQTAQTMEARAAQAVATSQDVERWALGVARAAVDRAQAADRRTASELEQSGLIGDGPTPAHPVTPSSSASGLGLLVTPLLGAPGALASLGQLVFGSASANPRSFGAWLTSPPPLPPPPPPPKPQHHSGGSVWGAIGMGIVALGADAFAGAQLGLDPLADGAAGAADTAEAGMIADVAADDAAVTATDAAASDAAASSVPVLSAEAADGAVVPLSEEEQAAAQAWAKELPTRPTPATGVKNIYEIQQTGEDNLLMKGSGEEIWADGFRSEDANALEAKCIVKPDQSPFIEGSNIPEPVRRNIINQVTSEITRYGAVVRDPSTPVRALEIVTNDPQAAQTLARLMEEQGVPGRVVVRP